MKKIKKYWKEILIGLLVIFSLNKCTVACNRDSKIGKQTVELTQKDSIIRVQSDSLNILKIRFSDAQSSQNTYQGIALNTKQELLDEINSKNIEINNLKNKVNQLTQENTKLKNDNRNLKNQLENK